MKWLVKKILRWSKGLFTFNYNINISDKITVNGKEITDPKEKEKILKKVKPAVDSAFIAMDQAMTAVDKTMDSVSNIKI